MIENLSSSASRRLDKIANWLAERIFSLFSGFFARKKIYLTYTPDSISHFQAYQQIYTLYEKFRKYNKLNNGGDLNRLISIVLNLEEILVEGNVQGAIAEVGVYKGNTACLLAYYAKKYDRKCFLFDTYQGFDKRDLEGIDGKFKNGEFSDTSLDSVKRVIGAEAVDNCQFIKGYFPESIPDYLNIERFAIVSLDCDLYKPMKAGLTWFYPRMQNGAIFLLHDYSSRYWEGAKKAINEFCSETNQHLVLLPDKSGSAFIRIHN
jgi:hypothetical protein